MILAAARGIPESANSVRPNHPGTCVIDDTTCAVIHLDTGGIIATNTIPTTPPGEPL